MPAAFLSYWKPDTARRELGRDPELFVHSASEQYHRASAGDIIWILTAWKGGIPVLLGRIVVDRVTDRRTAESVLGTSDLWEASYHIIAANGTAEPLRALDISGVVEDLRFDSKNDRLDVEQGRIKPAQLQSMRKLTAASHRLLSERWTNNLEIAEAIVDAAAADQRGQGFGTHEQNRETEMAAIAKVTAMFRSNGWDVSSVEQEHVGYDLLCKRGRETEHVEVKGVRGFALSFIITDGELTRAKVDEEFVLCVVLEACTTHSRIERFTGADVCSAFALRPLAYRAVRLSQED